MLSGSRRYLLVILLLLVAAGLTWGQRLSLASRLPPGAPVAQSEQEPAPGTPSPDQTATATPIPQFTYFLDVEGWYRITPYETVVRSPYDLTATTTGDMALALPEELGDWRQAGPDEDLAEDEAVIYYLGHPTVALQRSYENAAGQRLTLAVIGNKGDESFLLFSHTPETCYPGRLWQVTENRRESALLDDRPMNAQYLLTEHPEVDDKLMVLFFYLWDNPQRDSEEGVLSVRVNLFVAPGETEEEVLAQAWDFVRSLFPATIPWDRF